jgi:hypothetical protein
LSKFKIAHDGPEPVVAGATPAPLNSDPPRARLQIENLQARSLFAPDFHDSKLYASTFTPDGILDYGRGDVKGRDAIQKRRDCHGYSVTI